MMIGLVILVLVEAVDRLIVCVVRGDQLPRIEHLSVSQVCEHMVLIIPLYTPRSVELPDPQVANFVTGSYTDLREPTHQTQECRSHAAHCSRRLHQKRS